MDFMNSLADIPQLYLKFGRDIAFVHRRGYRTLRWTYLQTAELAFRFARELERRNIGKGDRVVLWGENSPEWVAAFFGCMLRGALAVPMDKAASPDFMQRVTDDVQARLVVCSTALAVHADRWPILELENLPDVLAEVSARPYTPVPLTRADTAEIVFTSGTTAEPRGVVLTHGNLLASLDPIENEIPKYIKYERIFHPLRFLDLLPLSHVFGQFLGMFIPPLIGGTVIFHDSFNPREIIEAIHRERVSVLVAVPRVMESLKHKIEHEFPEQIMRHFVPALNNRFPVRWLRFWKVHRLFGLKFWAIISGGATLDANTEDFWRRLGFGVIQGYGLTETSSMISLNHPFRVGHRSIGKVLPGREIALDPATGEILVRGDNVARQYWQHRELKPVTGEEGWFRTGDLGALDAEGNLYFKGRNKNVIVTAAGLNIYPEDLEHALRQQTEVRDCVVFGMAREGNAEAIAVLLLGDGAAADSAVARANASLADFQKIRRWFVWPDEDFPRTSTQKPKLAVIQEFVERQLGSKTRGAAASATLQELIQGIAHRNLEVDPGKLQAGAQLKDELNLSSLDRVELMSAIENRYQVDLSDREFLQIATVGELEELVKKSSRKTTPLDYPYAPWAQRRPINWIRLLIYYLFVWPATMIMAKPKVAGREHLNNFRGPALIICNHVTQTDIGFILAALPARLRHRLAVAMQGEMLRSMRHPPREWNIVRRWYEQLQYVLVTALFHVFSLPQRAGYRESFQYAGKLVDEGWSVVVFPEGKRTQSGTLNEFRKGIGLLAARLDLPVIPMHIHGLFALKQQKKYFSRPGSVQVHIGAPIRFENEADAEQITKRLQSVVEAL
jgi:long-chain acyl-CoA synthetase